MKSRLRKEMKQALAAIGPAESADRSHAACVLLTGLAEFRQGRTVMLYMPIRLEVDVTPAALVAWQQGKTVLVPKVDMTQRHMIAVHCRSLHDGLATGSFGIREPIDGEPWPIDQIDLIVVPALAYDRAGNRLGRGGGFYDRFLSAPDCRALTCGLAFTEQVVDELPVTQYDRRVQVLVTDKEVLRIHPDTGRRTAQGDNRK